jgi:hypothetical protein
LDDSRVIEIGGTYFMEPNNETPEGFKYRRTCRLCEFAAMVNMFSRIKFAKETTQVQEPMWEPTCKHGVTPKLSRMHYTY